MVETRMTVPIQILVVEDDVHIAKLISVLLQDAGYIVMAVGTAKAALEVVVELVGVPAVVAGFVPRWRIGGEEGLAGAKPVVEEFTRQRIGEAEGDEDSHLALLPMRQLVGRLFDVPSRIEELHTPS